MDCVAPGLLVAQAIGRLGNWWNQELYGKPTTLPWGLKIDPSHYGTAFYRPGTTFQPDVSLRAALEPARRGPACSGSGAGSRSGHRACSRCTWRCTASAGSGSRCSGSIPLTTSPVSG